MLLDSRYPPTAPLAASSGLSLGVFYFPFDHFQIVIASYHLLAIARVLFQVSKGPR